MKNRKLEVTLRMKYWWDRLSCQKKPPMSHAFPASKTNYVHEAESKPHAVTLSTCTDASGS